MLQALGISSEAEAAYIALVPLETVSVADLPAVLATDPQNARRVLDELTSLGLVIREGDRCRTLPLLEITPVLRQHRLSELEAAEAAAEALQNHLAAVHGEPEATVDVLIGREAIVAARNELCAAARRSICTFDKPPYVQSRPGATPESLRAESPEWQALERGVQLRCVYHPGFNEDRLSELALFAEAGEQSRTAPVPMKMFLFDRQLALIPSMRSYAPGQELRASVVRHTQLVEALQWLFEGVWESSVPIIRTGYENDPRRQMLTSLLMTGSTDSAIATQLGINVRSVRRWISELMDELGVTTRLQLGAAMVRADNLRSGAVASFE